MRRLHGTYPYSGSGQRRTLFCTHRPSAALFSQLGHSDCWVRADKYHPYGKDRRKGNYTIKYDLTRPELTDAQRRILAWPEQWEEFGLGDYGPGVLEEQNAKL